VEEFKKTSEETTQAIQKSTASLKEKIEHFRITPPNKFEAKQAMDDQKNNVKTEKGAALKAYQSISDELDKRFKTDHRVKSKSYEALKKTSDDFAKYIADGLDAFHERTDSLSKSKERLIELKKPIDQAVLEFKATYKELLPFVDTNTIIENLASCFESDNLNLSTTNSKILVSLPEPRYLPIKVETLDIEQDAIIIALFEMILKKDSVLKVDAQGVIEPQDKTSSLCRIVRFVNYWLPWNSHLREAESQSLISELDELHELMRGRKDSLHIACNIIGCSVANLEQGIVCDKNKARQDLINANETNKPHLVRWVKEFNAKRNSLEKGDSERARKPVPSEDLLKDIKSAFDGDRKAPKKFLKKDKSQTNKIKTKSDFTKILKEFGEKNIAYQEKYSYCYYLLEVPNGTYDHFKIWYTLGYYDYFNEKPKIPSENSTEEQEI